jgi:hypothetical protein
MWFTSPAYSFFFSRIVDCVPQNGDVGGGGVVLVVVITISLIFPDWPQLCRCSPHRTLLSAGFSVRALYHVMTFSPNEIQAFLATRQFI